MQHALQALLPTTNDLSISDMRILWNELYLYQPGWLKVRAQGTETGKYSNGLTSFEEIAAKQGRKQSVLVCKRKEQFKFTTPVRWSIMFPVFSEVIWQVLTFL